MGNTLVTTRVCVAHVAEMDICSCDDTSQCGCVWARRGKDGTGRWAATDRRLRFAPRVSLRFVSLRSVLLHFVSLRAFRFASSGRTAKRRHVVSAAVMPAHFHPHHMSTQTLILSHFANLKLAGDRVVRDAVQSLKQPPSPHGAPRPARHARPARRRRARRYRHASSRRINAMSDADLEAELAARRAARARERERYAKAMRSEKLAVLETELLRLRSEISRMDKTTPLGGGTPPTARWESLPNDRRSLRNSRSRPAAYPGASPTGSPQLGAAPDPSTPAPPRPPPGPPQMPPPPPPQIPVVDPERQKRERAERQRRREEKKKQREAMKKPLTLADIIKGAGPNPASRLKPSGSTPLPDVNEQQQDEKETFANLKDSLKKAQPENAPQNTNNEEATDDKNEPKDKAKQNAKPADHQEPPQPAKSDETDKNIQQEAPKANTEANTSKSSDILKSSAAPKQDDQKSTPEPTPPSKAEKSHTDSNKPKSTGTPIAQNDPVENKPSSPDAEKDSDKKQLDSTQTNGTQPHANGTKSNELFESNMSNDAQDAASALSALAAKLPKKTPTAGPDTEAKPSDSAPSAKRLSLQERRRLRRAAKESASTKND